MRDGGFYSSRAAGEAREGKNQYFVKCNYAPGMDCYTQWVNPIPRKSTQIALPRGRYAAWAVQQETLVNRLV